MIKNYLKIALRNLSRHKAFSIINIAGLAIGIASCLLLFTVIKYELSYDKFQPDYKQIYHVVTQDKFENGITYNPGIPIPALKALRLDFPQVATGSIFSSYGSQVTVIGANASNISADKKFIEETGFFFCDPQFFKVFHYDWVIGAPSVLDIPNNTVLTQKLAKKYFGDWKNATGQFLKLDNKVIVKVAGILKDPPPNTDFPLGIITSIKTAQANAETYSYFDTWNNVSSNFEVFMLLPKNISADNINNQLTQFSKKNYAVHASVKTSFLQPFSDIHFDKRLPNFGDHITSRSTLWTLSLIALFIIIMACINFINLSTAQAVGRSKEIGIRKVLGSYRWQLFGQMIGETALIVIASVVIAIAIAMLCLPFIKHIASIHEPLGFLNSQTILFLIILSVGVIFFAGTYPAFILSGFRPVLALKNKITSATVGGISIRRSLVVAQFAISQILIIGTIVAITQMSFVKNSDLGFNQEAVLLFNSNADSAMHAREESFKQKLLQIHGVKSLSFNTDVPSSDNSWQTNFAFNHKEDEKFQVSLKYADADYFETFGLQFLAGKPYDKSDTTKDVVINETMIRQLGLKNPQEAIGKDIRLGSSGWKNIVGVVKDFKTSSLRDAIKPTLICERKELYGVTAIKLNSSDISKTKKEIESAWNHYFPEYAFTSSYMDENIAKFYQQEDQLALLYKIFSGIAIFISCLGLYGLVSFMAIQKNKEIGIRKVLGASVKNIIYLFSKEFTILILVGSLIAVPVAWIMMNNWLQNFAFRIKINFEIFFMAILLSIIIAWIAVGYKSIKAAIANPVKSLRSE
ncbi:MAG: ABC transporter permease [Bacteroidota bacterium]|nr:ABC transporter permease [Bacteroidota bacterium]